MSELRAFQTNIFGGEVEVVVAPLTASRKRTKSNQDQLDRGIHPATHQPLLGGDLHCGDCAHCLGKGERFKCEYHHRGAQLVSAVTDIRLRWPACIAFDQKPGR